MRDGAAAAGEGRFARRGFIRLAGAAGIGAAVALFGRSAPALAYGGCCSFPEPPDTSYSYCVRGGGFTWSCSEDGGYLYCNCCYSSRLQGYQCQYDAAGRAGGPAPGDDPVPAARRPGPQEGRARG